MLFVKSVAASAVALLVFTHEVAAVTKNWTPVKYYGSKGPLLSGGTSTKAPLVYTSGTVPSLNGTIVSGGIAAQTKQVLDNIAEIFEEAGTSWEYALKTTVFLANMSDFAAMNAVYGEYLPELKPARTTVQVVLPGVFLIEIEAVAAIPEVSWG